MIDHVQEIGDKQTTDCVNSPEPISVSLLPGDSVRLHLTPILFSPLMRLLGHMFPGLKVTIVDPFDD